MHVNSLCLITKKNSQKVAVCLDPLEIVNKSSVVLGQSELHKSNIRTFWITIASPLQFQSTSVIADPTGSNNKQGCNLRSSETLHGFYSNLFFIWRNVITKVFCFGILNSFKLISILMKLFKMIRFIYIHYNRNCGLKCILIY